MGPALERMRLDKAAWKDTEEVACLIFVLQECKVATWRAGVGGRRNRNQGKKNGR